MTDILEFEGVSSILTDATNPFSLLDAMHEPATGKGLMLKDIDALFELMYSNAVADPDMLYVSVHRYERVRHMYKPYLRKLRHKKIERRQHRATYRRKKRGIA